MGLKIKDGTPEMPFQKHHKWKPGQFVSVRPCADEYEGKTFLGILIGELATAVMLNIVDKSKGWSDAELEMQYINFNPMIFIPERHVVFGFGSWWRPIESESDLNEITDADIQDIWYVKALKAMAQHQEPEDRETE
jgi:hypothetical protein